MKTPHRLLTETEETAARNRIARLRYVMFSLPEADQEAAGREIEQIKAECAATWDARASIRRGEMLAGAGY